MAYRSEKASKINHQYVIENEKVRDFLLECEKMGDSTPLEVDALSSRIEIDSIENKVQSHIEHIVAIDGGYQEINISGDYPSQKLCYYSAGILTFRVNDLENLEEKRIINPKDLNKLENLERFNFVIPVQNIRLKGKDFEETIRQKIFDIFVDNTLAKEDKEYAFINTIKWLVFREYKDSLGSITFACPRCSYLNNFQRQSPNYLDDINNSMYCGECETILYITDCFELHTLVDEINGASLIESYILSVFEIILMLSMFRFFYEKNMQLLHKVLFIKDGPLALFSRLDDFSSKIVRPFFQFLYDKSIENKLNYVNVVGLDKGGMFVEHFSNIDSKIPSCSIVLPNLDYMKKYITGNNNSVFGENTYFGIKMFVKVDRNLSFLLNVVVPFGENIQYKEYIKQPNISDFLNLKDILEILVKIKCDMYDKSFIPVAMINKLVSLSNIPSKKLLTIFSKDIVGQ